MQLVQELVLEVLRQLGSTSLGPDKGLLRDVEDVEEEEENGQEAGGEDEAGDEQAVAQRWALCLRLALRCCSSSNSSTDGVDGAAEEEAQEGWHGGCSLEEVMEGLHLELLVRPEVGPPIGQGVLSTLPALAYASPVQRSTQRRAGHITASVSAAGGCAMNSSEAAAAAAAALDAGDLGALVRCGLPPAPPDLLLLAAVANAAPAAAPWVADALLACAGACRWGLGSAA